MERTFVKAPFPHDSSSNAFSSTFVYWRPAAAPSDLPLVGQAADESGTGQRDASAPGSEAELVTPTHLLP